MGWLWHVMDVVDVMDVMDGTRHGFVRLADVLGTYGGGVYAYDESECSRHTIPHEQVRAFGCATNISGGRVKHNIKKTTKKNDRVIPQCS